MSRPKRTANLVAEIRSRSRDGLSARQIAKEKGISRQTVDRALATKPVAEASTKARTPVAQPPRGAVQADPADHDELRALLAELARGLSAQAREAQGTGDAAAYATLAGKAQSAVLALAKLSPVAPEAEEEGTYVTHEAMAKEAARVRTALLERVARRARGER